MRQKVSWLLTGILAIAFVLSMSGQSRSELRFQQPMPAGFEYRFVPVILGRDLKSGEALINEYDAEGWELIAVQALTAANGDRTFRSQNGGFFKRIDDSFSAADRLPKVKNVIDKADALYIFKRVKATP